MIRKLSLVLAILAVLVHRGPLTAVAEGTVGTAAIIAITAVTMATTSSA